MFIKYTANYKKYSKIYFRYSMRKRHFTFFGLCKQNNQKIQNDNQNLVILNQNGETMGPATISTLFGTF